jgi:hypothetical protein
LVRIDPLAWETAREVRFSLAISSRPLKEVGLVIYIARRQRTKIGARSRVAVQASIFSKWAGRQARTDNEAVDFGVFLLELRVQASVLQRRKFGAREDGIGERSLGEWKRPFWRG